MQRALRGPEALLDQLGRPTLLLHGQSSRHGIVGCTRVDQQGSPGYSAGDPHGQDVDRIEDHLDRHLKACRHIRKQRVPDQQHGHGHRRQETPAEGEQQAADARSQSSQLGHSMPVGKGGAGLADIHDDRREKNDTRIDRRHAPTR